MIFATGEHHTQPTPAVIGEVAARGQPRVFRSAVAIITITSHIVLFLRFVEGR
jgi:hypothetical protein